ncbi:unnamed protein product [Microthlaspi erraticum]|uniref:Uncharacterized protein n=1 Tax=Microthlaspi erraticum TaxID=1685480 RepID=A0A6D2I107_9BRAS|nr:unnamed protein product [Microthlaspi erraticum]
MIKIAKTGPGGSIEKPRPKCGTAGRGTSVHGRPTSERSSVPLNNGRAHVPIREASSRGRPNQNHKAKPHEPGSIASRPCGTTHTAADTVRPGRPRPTSGQILRPLSSVRPNPTNERKTLGHDRPTVPIADHDPIAGRTSRPTVRTVRSTRSRF